MNAARTRHPPGRRQRWWWFTLLFLATVVPWLPRLSSYSDQMGLLARWSYDWLYALRGVTPQKEVVIVEIDQKSLGAQAQDKSGLLDRAVHARLLRKLAEAKARLVVMDLFFDQAGNPETDRELAEAMIAHGRVVIGVDLLKLRGAGIEGSEPNFPVEPMRSAAKGLGLLKPDKDSDGVVRRHFYEAEQLESLPWVAARLAGAASLAEYHRRQPRWLQYYGSTRKSLLRLRYDDALAQAPDYFQDKYVFIGGSLWIKKPGEQSDMFRTPYTAWDGDEAPGVDLVAINFLNLLKEDALLRLAPFPEFFLLIASGFLVGCAGLVRNWRWRLLSWLGIGGAVAGWALALPVYGHLWFSWLVVFLIQLPLAVLGSSWLHQPLSAHATRLPEVKAAALPAPATRPPADHPAAPVGEIPVVADHTLLRRVGSGAYGDVWVARNAVGIFHAVKVIHRRAFESSEPFEREFRGITRFMPISRSHPGFVHVLQVGPEEVGEYFYYVMELADDVTTGAKIDANAYQPKNLDNQLKRQKRLTPQQCLQLGLQMSDALHQLHQAQLIHRDIKPSNIIFVRGLPKLADIGLVTRIAQDPRDVSFLGTRGYIAPEGPGTPLADIYSLGKVLYEAYTGLDREQFPSLPTSLLETPSPALAELNQLVLKACELAPAQRYQSAAEFHFKLASLQARLARLTEVP